MKAFCKTEMNLPDKFEVEKSKVDFSTTIAFNIKCF